MPAMERDGRMGAGGLPEPAAIPQGGVGEFRALVCGPEGSLRARVESIAGDSGFELSMAPCDEALGTILNSDLDAVFAVGSAGDPAIAAVLDAAARSDAGPLVVVVGPDSPEGIREALSRGALDCLPADEHLEERLRACLKRVRSLAAARRSLGSGIVAAASGAWTDQVLRTVQDDVWICDDAHRTILVTERLARKLGYSVGEVLGKHVLDFVAHAEREDQQRRLAGRSAGQKDIFVRRLLTKDGREIPFLVTAAPSMDETGRFTGSVALLTDLTERQELGAKLIETREAFRSVLGTAPCGLLVLRGGVIVYANDVLLNLVRRSRGEVFDRDARVLFPDDSTWHAAEEALRTQLAASGRAEMETRLRAGPDATVEVLIVATCADRRDPCSTVTAAVIDLTERRARDRELEEVRGFWEATFAAIPDCVFLLDSEQRILMANPACRERLGLSEDTEIVGRKCYEVIHGREDPPGWCPFCLLTRENEARTVRMHEPRLGGHYDVSVAAVPSVEGTPPFYVHVARDVNRIVESERELLRRHAWLQSLYALATRRFASDQELVEFAVGDCVRHTESRYGFCHFVAPDGVNLELFAWSEEARKECRLEASRIYPWSQAGIWADAVRLRRPVICNDYRNAPDRKGYPEGHLSINRFLSVPVLEDDRVVIVAGVANRQEPYGEIDAQEMQVFLSDVWHILSAYRAQRELEAMNRELETRVQARTSELQSANELLDAYARNVAHDLRGYVYRVNSYLSLLKERLPELDDEGKQHLTYLEANVKRLQDIVEALTRLSRETRGPVNRERVDLTATAREVLEVLLPRYPSARVDVEDGLHAFCDRQFAARVLENLLGNALKYSQYSTSPAVQFGLTERNGKRLFYVQDNGVGFDSASGTDIFAPLRRYHESSEFEGLGIGLSIVDRIIKRHGGQIFAESAPGQGATFYFDFGPETFGTDEA